MEKYSKWRDGPTGIHPLLPNQSQPTPLITTLIFKVILGLVLAVLRLPVVVVLTLLLVTIDILIKYIPIGIVKRLTKRFFAVVLGRLILLFMGFIHLDEYTETIGNSKSEPVGSVKKYALNDVFIVNHSSYVDVIYLYYKLSPLFAVPPNDKDPTNVEGKLVYLSLYKALLNAVYSPIQPASYAVPTSTLVKRINETFDGPLVVFPEGTTSNGQGLLNIAPVFTHTSGIASLDHIHVLGLSYHTSYYSACYSSVGGFFIHLCKLVSQYSNLLQAKYLDRSKLPALPTSTNHSLYDHDIQLWFDNLFKTLSSLVNARRTKITSYDKLQFLSYWNGYKVKDE